MAKAFIAALKQVTRVGSTQRETSYDDLRGVCRRHDPDCFDPLRHVFESPMSGVILSAAALDVGAWLVFGIATRMPRRPIFAHSPTRNRRPGVSFNARERSPRWLESLSFLPHDQSMNLAQYQMR
jgi:hypothetical protein